jgi:hypothetical protein
MEVTVKLSKAELEDEDCCNACYLMPCNLCPVNFLSCGNLNDYILKNGLVIDINRVKYTFLKPEE